MRLRSYFSFQERASLPCESVCSYLVRVSTYAASWSISRECFCPMAPEEGVTRCRLMFFWWSLACEEVVEVFCMWLWGTDISKNIVCYNSSMIDFSKVYCKVHPYEPVNNFCADKNCLVGLCPTCVCEHTAMHMQNKTQPQFENIRTTFSRVHEEIQGQIDVVVADKERLGNLMGSIKEKKENFKAVLMKSRNDCLQLVKDHFDGLQKQWEEEIANEEKRHTLHSSYRLDTLSALLSKEISELIDESRRMNSVSFVEEIPRIQKEALVDSRAFHTRISQELDDNERYTPIINYSPQYLKEVGEGLKRLLSLEFSIPMKKYISSTNSQLMSRVGNISFRAETPKKEGGQAQMQHSLVVRRSSTEKMQQSTPQVTMTQSALYSVPAVPMVLTTSFLNSPPQQARPVSNQSQATEKSRMSKINFSPSYVDRVQLNRFAKGDMQTMSRTTLKHKKSGLSLLGNQSQGECVISQKENSRK